MKSHKNLLLLLAVVAIVLTAFIFVPQGVEFGGTDNAAEAAIGTLNKSYEPWFSPLFEPASSEVESLLFTLQGSIGTGIIFYVIGYYRGKNRPDTGK